MSYDPPPEGASTSPSDYDKFFGDGSKVAPVEGSGWGGNGDGQGMNAVSGEQANQARANVSNPGTPTPQNVVVKYPDVTENNLVESIKEDGAVEAPPTEETPVPMSVKLPSGYEIDLTSEQVGETFVKNQELREKAEAYDEFRSWSTSHPDGAAQVMNIIRGQEVEDPYRNSTSQPKTPGDDDLFGDEEFLEDESTKQMKGQIDHLNAQVQSMSTQLGRHREVEQERTDMNALTVVQNKLNGALGEHPFTKDADSETRKAIMELALVDVRRYQHEGVTHEMAVSRWANHFENLRRQELGAQMDKADNRPAVPPPPGSGAVIPRPAQPEAGNAPGGFFDSGQFGSGLRQALTTKRGE